MIRTLPHVAFKVADLDRAIGGYNVLLGPYEPLPDFRVAIIEDGGHPVELVQTALTDDELWTRAEAAGILDADSASNREPSTSPDEKDG